MRVAEQVTTGTQQEPAEIIPLFDAPVCWDIQIRLVTLIQEAMYRWLHGPRTGGHLRIGGQL